ncbi:methyltransferase domain-containing protein [bacterium]|nr:methyltransferase domain-containing protein [bacterium]
MPSNPRSLRQRLFPTCHRSILEKFLSDFLPQNISGDVLIVGAGHSPHGQLLGKNCRVTAVDIEPLPGIDIVADIRDLPLEDASFDHVLCIEVLEHIFDTQKALNEMQRVLKPGGSMVITTPFLFHIHGDPNDFVRLSKNYFEEALSQSCESDAFYFGNRLHVFLDLVTTASKALAPIRLTSHFLTPLSRCLRTTSDAPSGTIVVAKKKMGLKHEI